MDMIVPGSAYAVIQRTVFRNGWRKALAYVLVAALVNHIRRILVPWLGQFVWYHALGNMKLAKGSPHYFLEVSLGYGWGEVFWWAGQTYAWSIIWRMLSEKIVSAEKTMASQQEQAQKRKSLGQTREEIILEMKLDTYRVVLLTLVLAHFEHAYTETCWAGAHMYAIRHILRNGNPEERLFVSRLVRSQWHRVPLLLGIFLRWCLATALPNMLRLIVMAGKGNPVPLLACVGVGYETGYLVRYSNKYFMLLEMSDMLITFGWMWVGAGFVVVEMAQRWWR